MTIRVLLADDQELLRTGFRMILEAEPDMRWSARPSTGPTRSAPRPRHGRTVVLMDIRMPVMDGVTATQKLTSLSAEIRVLILTTFHLDEYVMKALRAGPPGSCSRTCGPPIWSRPYGWSRRAMASSPPR